MKPQEISSERQAELYRRYRNDLVIQGMLGRVREGVFPGCAPVGYRNATEDGKPVIVVDLKLAPIVQKAFRLAATGKYSLRKLLHILTAEGLITRNGKVMQPSALRAMLRNPFYIGRIRYYGVLLPGKHEVLVDEELFWKVVEQMRKPKQ